MVMGYAGGDKALGWAWVEVAQLTMDIAPLSLSRPSIPPSCPSQPHASQTPRSRPSQALPQTSPSCVPHVDPLLPSSALLPPQLTSKKPSIRFSTSPCSSNHPCAYRPASSTPSCLAHPSVSTLSHHSLPLTSPPKTLAISPPRSPP